MASIHDKLNRVRKPRVHISYEVETEGAMVKKDLPFVVGVMGDFSGDPTQLKVDNTLEGDGSQMAVNLQFNSMDDFSPARVVDQVEPLRKLMETRNKLRDLMTKVDRSEELEGLLEDVLQDQDKLNTLAQDLGSAGGEG